VLIAFIISGTAANTFMSVYTASIDSFITCFLYDKYFTPKGKNLKFASEEIKKFIKKIYPNLEQEEIDDPTINNLYQD
jgi:hypothetical protein